MSQENHNSCQQIINLSDLDPEWCWLASEFSSPEIKWRHFSSRSINLPAIIPKKDSISRMLAAKQAINLAKQSPSVIVSHGPRPTLYSALMKSSNQGIPHLAYSFNFTTLPTGIQQKVMAKAYSNVDRFVVFSSYEKKLYAEYFNIDIDKIDFLHWSVHAPSIENIAAPVEQGNYICAIGSQGRDYDVLFRAMEKLKDIRLVLVATKESIQNLNVPDNVTVHTNIPLAQAHNILFHSRFMVVPLRDNTVPCGHVTIVSGMFLKKAMLVTDSEGVHDYIVDNKTGKLFKDNDINSLKENIESLWNSNSDIKLLSDGASRFALSNCTEKNVVSYFDNFLKGINNQQW